MEMEVSSDSDVSMHSVILEEDMSPFDYVDYENLTSIAKAVFSGNVALLRDLILQDKLVTYKDNQDCTLLHYAMKKNNLQVLNILLGHSKINLDSKNVNGETPLHIGIGAATDDMVSRLIDAGCDIIGDCTNTTPLHLAIMKQPSIVEKLIKSGADINAVSFIEGTPLHTAVRVNNFECVSMLLYYNADTSIICHGPSAFFLSINSVTNEQIAYELLKYCSDFTITDDDNCNCFLLAVRNRHKIANELVELIGDGINTITADPEGLTALHYSLSHSTNALFKLIWSKMDHRVLLNAKVDFLNTLIKICEFNSKDWLECLYLVLESEIVTDLILFNDYNYEFPFGSSSLFRSLVVNFKLREIESIDRVKIIWGFLSFGTRVVAWDVNIVYKLFGICEELYIFTSVDIVYNGINELYTIVAFIMGSRFYFDDYNAEFRMDMKAEFREGNLILLSKYFALYHCLSKYTCLNPNVNLYLVNKLCRENKIECKMIPSLVELSRDMSRCYIREHYPVKKTYMFNNVVNNLELPKVIKNIITFKTPIYYK